MKKSNTSSTFLNSKGGSLGFGKILKIVTGKRAASKKMKTGGDDAAYLVKSAANGILFTGAFVKAKVLKGADVTNSVVVAADPKTGDKFIKSTIENDVIKHVKKINKGDFDFAGKHQIATSRAFEKASTNDAITARLNLLSDDDMTDDVKTIKALMKSMKADYSDYKRDNFNQAFVDLID